MKAIDADRLEVLTFDCYGTLIDWESGIRDALRSVLAAHGIELSARQILEAYAELEPPLQKGAFRPYREVLTELVRAFGRRYGFEPTAEEAGILADSIGEWPPFPDTVEALGRFGARYRLGVISNVDEDLFERTERHLQVPFDHVVTAERARAYKPDARPFQLALAELDLPAGRVLHVAQSLFHDIVPAGRLGIPTAWVDRRAGREGSGATPAVGSAPGARPDLVVSDLHGLAALLFGKS